MPIDRQIEQVFVKARTGAPHGSAEGLIDAAGPAAACSVGPDVAAVIDHSIDTLRRALRARCYHPPVGIPGTAAMDGSSVRPAILYLPGDGAPRQAADGQDALCRRLAKACRALVIVLDRQGSRGGPGAEARVATVPANTSNAQERLADALATVRWLRAHAVDLAIDPQRLAIAGEGTGAYLAVRTLIDLREAGDPPLAMHVLISPVLDLVDLDGGEAPGWLAESAAGEAIDRHLEAVVQQLRTWRDTAFAGAGPLDGPMLSPMRATSLAGLPPAFVLSAGADPLRGQAQRWVDRLHAAGIDAAHECFEGMVHGFVFMGPEVAGAGHAVARMAQHLRPVLRSVLRHRFT